MANNDRGLAQENSEQGSGHRLVVLLILRIAPRIFTTPNSYFRDLSPRLFVRLDLCSMRRHWRQGPGVLLLALTLTSPYLFGQEGSENARTVVRKVQPQYPALAQKMNIKGSVKLEVVVEPDGSVKSMNAKGGHPVLVQSAQDAIRQWKWQAASHETLESVEVRFNPQ